MRFSILDFRFSIGCICAVALAAHATQTIRVYKVGSSSFPNELMINAKYIAEASADVVIEFDGAGYTRLDQFITRPYLYSEWTNQYWPVIYNGNYDYVIFQTIGWFNLKPDGHERLVTEIIPDLASNVHAAGARMVLYDKYVALLRGESDPLARTWAGRYPEGVYLNYLLHVMAGKCGGFSNVTFGGAAVHELWDVPYYGDLDFLFNEGGHPGAMANYISACDLSHIMTGVVPTGNTVRAVKLTGWQAGAFENLVYGDADAIALYVANSNRVHDGHLYLTEDEAATLQQTAMNWHLAWSATLNSNLVYDSAYTFTTSEIARIHGEITNYAAYNLSQGAIDSLNAQFEEVGEWELTDREIDKILGDTREYGATVRAYAGQFLDPDEVKQLQADYIGYWTARNSKLRDDVYFEALCYLTLLQRGTNADEVSRVGESAGTLGSILSLAGMELLLERITPAQRQQIMDGYKWGGARKQHCPLFYEAQMNATGDWQRLIAVWERYFSVWDDPNLMDELKGVEEGELPYTTNSFLKSVWLKADQRFSELPEEIALGSVGAVTVPENGTNGFGLRLTGIPGPGVTITVGVARVSATNCDIVVIGGTPCYFTSADWDIAQAVALVAHDDAGFLNGTALFRCTPSAGTAMDVDVGELDDDNLPPATPGHVSPADGATAQTLTPELQASAFSDPNPGDVHAASHWQLATNAALTAIAWDSGTDSVHLTSVTLPELRAGRRYWWRVRYRDVNGVFSDYSTPTWFETDPLLTRPPAANSDIYEVPPGGVLDVAAPGVLINDTDADGDPLTAIKLSDPTEGLLTLRADGSFVYAPATNWVGADSFTYCASDGTTSSPGVLCQLVAADMGTQDMMVCEYFTYGVTGGSLAGMSTLNAVGWETNTWSGSANPEYRPFSAAFISAAGEAQAYSNRLAGGCLRGADGEAGTLTRGLSPPLDGTVWVSLVVTCSWWNSPPDLSKNHAQVVINGRNADRFGVMTSGSSTRQRLLVYENGVMFTNDVVGAGSGRSALLVARLRTNVSGTDDELTAWLFPDGGALPDGRALTNLGAPLYTTSGAQDLWGDTIASVGLTIMSQSDTREIYVDSLRVSYGDIPDDAHVHKVLAGEAIPEPLGAMGAVFALWSASMFRRRRI